MNRSRLRRRRFLGAVGTGVGTVAGCLGGGSGDEAERPTQDPDATVWNVADHGIVGDGTTEVGGRVHELLDAVDADGGGVVSFPPGRYLFERTPLVGDDTVLVGAGRSTVFEGVRPDGTTGRALISNKGYDETAYSGASNWGIRDVRIDSPDSNGIMPAHAENVRLENVHGDAVYYHHIDIVSCRGVTVDGYRATRGGEGDSDAPIQFDAQRSGVSANEIWDGSETAPTNDDDTPTTRCRLTDFVIDPENAPSHGIHLHRGGHESVAITDGYVAGCRFTAVRSDPGGSITDLTISRVSCLDNARGITLGHVERGRTDLTISDVTIRTNDGETAAGSGVYAAGFDGAGVSNVVVDGEFTNSVVFDDMIDLKMSTITATGAVNQAFRFRENVDATLTTARAADCGGAGIYSGPGSSVAYGGVSFENVGTEVGGDGEFREWTAADPR